MEKTNSNLAPTVELNQVPAILNVLNKAGLTANLVGVQGIGKSEIVRQYAKQFGFEGVIDLRLGQMEVGDLVGLPRVMEVKAQKKSGEPEWLTVWGRPCWFPTSGKWVLFMDEWNRAGTTDVIQAVFQLFLDRKLHTNTLPDEVQVVCAMNPADKGFMVNKIKDKALMDRLVHINVSPTTAEFLKWGKDNLRPDVFAFVQTTPAVLGNRTFIAERREPSARSLHMLSRVEAVCSKEEWDLYGATIASGLIGQDFAIQYIKFKADREYKPLTDMDILENYTKNKKKLEAWANPDNLRLDVLSATLDNVRDFYRKFESQEDFDKNFPDKKVLDKYKANHLAFCKILPKDLLMKHFKEILTLKCFVFAISISKEIATIATGETDEE